MNRARGWGDYTTGRLHPKGVPFLSLQYSKGWGEIVILVYERVTKLAAKWKRWRLKLSMQKGAKFYETLLSTPPPHG